MDIGEKAGKKVCINAFKSKERLLSIFKWSFWPFGYNFLEKKPDIRYVNH